VRKDTIRRIVIRAPNWIGDAVMSEPAVSMVRTLFPQAEVTLLAKPIIAELFAHHPGIHRILVYDDRGRHAGLSGKWTLARVLRRHRFDLAMLLQNAFEAALLAFLAGIPRRYGYGTDGRALLLTDPLTVPPRGTLMHQVDYYWNLVTPFGARGIPTAPRLFVSKQEEISIEARLADAGISPSDLLIGVNPGSTYGSAKRWLPERYAGTVNRLVEEHRSGDVRIGVVILGGKGEERLGQSIAEHIHTRTVVCSGHTTVRELMALTKRCRLFLTNDTGPMHIASAFNVPAVAIFGPTDWRTTAPFGPGAKLVRHAVPCAPCLLRECPIDHRCMTGVTVEDVARAAQEHLARYGHGAQASAAPASSPPRMPGPLLPLKDVTVFLDRDGTLNEDTGFVKSPEELCILPAVPAALARLKRGGARLIVVTNQSGVGRGLMSLTDLESIHATLRERLAGERVALDAIYFCPHHPDDGCVCRKPKPGMVERATAEFHIDLSRSYLVGDQARDIELAHRAGMKSILVTTGPPGRQPLEELHARGLAPTVVLPSLSAGVDWIYKDAARGHWVSPQLHMTP
jgi:heptosyltransferase-2